MSDKMREEFEKWYMMQPIAHKSHIVRISTGHYFGAHTETAWQAWQAAKWQDLQAAQSVPVVGEPVANQCDGCCRGLMVDDDGMHRAESGHPVMVCERPVYDAAELERLRKDAARWRFISEFITYEDDGCYVRPVLDSDSLSEVSSMAESTTFHEYIDAAIAAEGTGNG